ncbi:MAG TPA: TIGR00730 family Rossman fold protein [Acetobacteraceae bacterium]|nr:TIGR00730 family Rossman fold protein [Acetobacteraceae bacterium]
MPGSKPEKRHEAKPHDPAPGAGLRGVAVFCGAQAGHDPACRAGAEALGRGLAEAGLRLVYGGGRIGLMGALADAAVAAGGVVVGVIPEFLTRREVAHQQIAELIVTDSMHSRKQRMFELADAFVMLPGGLGTLDEIVEIITWRQLALHNKPILLCNVAGAAMPLLALVDAVIDTGFAQPDVRRLFEVAADVPALLARLQQLHRGSGGPAKRL